VRPIEQLNTLSEEEFAEALKPLFEAAHPLATALYDRRPFPSYEVLIDTAEALALAMPLAQQVDLLAAHPRIGAPPETLSRASLNEQGSQGLESEFAALNEVYESRFGFRFVVFVNKRPRSEILNVLRQRLTRTQDDELRTALHALFSIARDRLHSAT
jgi:2-oxo-4-hydroxy-4-carboxy--5-ureidoimidazoline (OHCU) decarboxylase